MSDIIIDDSSRYVIAKRAVRAEKGFLLGTHTAKGIAFDIFLIVRFPETAKTLIKDGVAPKRTLRR